MGLLLAPAVLEIVGHGVSASFVLDQDFLPVFFWSASMRRSASARVIGLLRSPALAVTTSRCDF